MNIVRKLVYYRVYIIAVIVIAFSSLTAWRWIFNQDSIQAFVNARVIEVRSPIAGIWTPNNQLVEVGKIIKTGELFGEVKGSDVNTIAVNLKLQMAELERSIANRVENIRNLRERIDNRLNRLSNFQQILTNQMSLKTQNGEHNLTEVEAQLSEARYEYTYTQSKAKRINAIAKNGLVSNFEQEQTEISQQMANARVVALMSKLEKAKLEFKADQLGLQLDGVMTFSYPQMRVEELEDELKDLNLDLKLNQVELKSLKQQLQIVTYAQQKEDYRFLAMDRPSLVWSIEAQGAAQVAREETLFRIIDCSDLWVEAFVDESAASVYKQGDQVNVSPINGNEIWNGRVQFIRYGTGRITIGQPITAPPPEIARRQLPVRVATLIIQVELQSHNNDSGQCPAGLSVTVQHTNQ